MQDGEAKDSPAAPLAAGTGRAGRGATLRWLSWLLGIAMLALVVMASLHFSEGQEMVRIARAAHPWWLAVAFLLQAATYLAQGEIWRVVTRAAGVRLGVWEAFRLSLAMLFMDQALPSAGISGFLLVGRALAQRGLERAVVMAALVVDMVSYYGAYIAALALALLVALAELSTGMLLAALAFVLLSVVLAAALLALTGRRSAPPWLLRVPLLRTVVSLLGAADPRLARSPALILRSVALQLVIVLLDAGTVWVLLRSLGETAPFAGVYASFMAANLLRTVSIVPGGLGVFEAASVLTLRLTGVPLPAALAATLLFRGLSFWLPMLPGLYFSHRLRATL